MAERHERLVSLDGLRGIAALVVLLHHSALTFPSFAATYFVDEPPEPGSPLWWLVATPLKLLTAGSEAVMVFFVLSGLVVALPAMRNPGFSWAKYYPQRLLRLGIPVVLSVFLAAFWVALLPQDASVATSEWTARSASSGVGWTEVARSLDLVRGSTHINNPLWSLQWEVIFSLLLPVYVLLSLSLRRWAPWVLVVATVGIGIGSYAGAPGMRYLLAFALGTVLAANLDRLRRVAIRIGHRRFADVWFAGILVAGLTLLVSKWLLWPLAPEDQVVESVGRALSGAGAAAIVFSAAFWSPVKRALSTPFSQWAGRISFSLYLVHVPVILFFSFLFGRGSEFVALLIAVPLSIVLAMLFARFVEQPAHDLSKAVSAMLVEKSTVVGREAVPELQR